MPHLSNPEQRPDQGSALFEKVSARIKIIRPALECVINAVNIQDPRIQYNESIEAQAAKEYEQKQQEQLLGAMDYGQIEAIPALQPLRSAVAQANAARLAESAREAVNKAATDEGNYHNQHTRVITKAEPADDAPQPGENILTFQPNPDYLEKIDQDTSPTVADPMEQINVAA